MEIWKDIRDFEGLYQASNLGRIKRLERFDIGRRDCKRKIKEKILKGAIKKTGYIEYSLSKNGKRQWLLGHRLIGMTFIENKYNKPQVNHKDGNKQNNKLSNLEWSTMSENMKHSYDILGQKPAHLGKFGKLNHKSKPIKQYDLEGNFIKSWENSREVYRELKLDASAISACCKGITKTSGKFKWEYILT